MICLGWFLFGLIWGVAGALVALEVVTSKRGG